MIMPRRVRRRIGPPFPFVATPAPTSAPGPSIVTDGLTHYYPMDDVNVDTSGATPIIKDIVGGASFDATANSTGITSVAGPKGTDTARQFNGSSWAASSANLFSDLVNNTSSGCVWFYIPSITALEGAFFYNASDGTEAVGSLWASAASTGGSDEYECATVNSTGPNSTTTAHSISESTWTFLAWTHATGVGGNCTFYENGDSPLTTGGAASQGANVSSNCIGARQPNSRVMPNGCRLAHLMLYENKVLSATEVLQNYNATH